jgi:hemimethylated DNA binding protein
MKAASFGLSRQLLRYRALYNGDVRAVLRSMPKHMHNTFNLAGSRELYKLIAGADRSFPPMEAVMRDPGASPAFALEALRGLQKLEQRLGQTHHKSLVNVPYSLEVGDVVEHCRFGHIGVVAARLPLCMESDEWVVQNMGSTADARLAYPWYLILVARHEGLPIDFVRYGSQLTHTKVPVGRAIGFHRMLPQYFAGFDQAEGRYVPRFPSLSGDGPTLTPTTAAVETEVLLEDVPPPAKKPTAAEATG